MSTQFVAQPFVDGSVRYTLVQFFLREAANAVQNFGWEHDAQSRSELRARLLVPSDVDDDKLGDWQQHGSPWEPPRVQELGIGKIHAPVHVEWQICHTADFQRNVRNDDSNPPHPTFVIGSELVVAMVGPQPGHRPRIRQTDRCGEDAKDKGPSASTIRHDPR